MEGLINAANILYLVSYFVRDILKLRILTVVAASCLIVYFYSQPQPLMACVYWNLFFVIQNLVWIGRLLVQHRPRPTSPADRAAEGQSVPRVPSLHEKDHEAGTEYGPDRRREGGVRLATC